MRYLLKQKRIIPVLLLTIISMMPWPALAQSPESAQTNVQPRSGLAGTRFFFVATGFAPFEPVAVWLNTPDGRAIAAEVDDLNRANAQGRADWSWSAPTTAQPGPWQMVVHGQDSGIEQVIGFTIEAQPLPEQATNVQPRSGLAGTRFFFVATGFAPFEPVAVWLNTPDGRAIAAEVDDLNRANAQGRADWPWSAPTTAQPGPWQMVARGQESSVEHVIGFEIRAQDTLTNP